MALSFTPAQRAEALRRMTPAMREEFDSLLRDFEPKEVDSFGLWLPEASPTWSWNWRHLVEVRKALMGVTRGETKRLMIYMPPRHGKPLYNKSMILMHNGSRREISDIRVGEFVISHTGRARRVTAVIPQGDLPCLRIRTETEREVLAAHDHPFLTPDGWVKASDLRAGMVLANVVCPQTNATQSDRPAEEFRLAGYFVGDGHCAATNHGAGFAANITNADTDIIGDIRACAETMGFRTNIGKMYRETPCVRVNVTGGIRQWLRDAGLARKNSRSKRVPAWVFEGSNYQVANFLAAYIGCDGSVTRRGAARGDLAVEVYSVSRELLHDVQHLLLRLGVQSRLGLKHGQYKGEVHTSYRLGITSQDDAAMFRARVPMIGHRLQLLEEWTIHRQRFDGPLRADRIESIEDAGVRPCTCLTVEEDHSYTAEDLVVHNSEQTTIRYPVWRLERWPETRVCVGCYNQRFAEKFGRKSRQLAEKRGVVSKNRRAAMEWETNQGGVYRSCGVGSPPTGEGFNLIVLDDMIKSREEAESEAYRERAWEWYQDIYTRLEPDAAIIIQMTRWHADDPAGRLIEESERGGDQWKIVVRPAIDDDGKALWPERFPRPVLEQYRRVLGEYAFEALYQQRPTAREGNLFKVDRILEEKEPEAYPVRVRAWDLSATPGGGDWSVGFLLGRNLAGDRWCILDLVRGRWSADERNAIIRATAVMDGMDTRVRFAQDPGQAGKEQAQGLVGMLAGYVAGSKNVTGPKITRADPFAAQVNAGNVSMVKASWNREVREELRQFPSGKFDDIVDSGSDAFAELASAAPWAFY